MDRGSDAATQSPLARDTLSSLVAISLVGGSSALYSLLVGRLLGESALGHAALALAVGLGVAQLATAGIGPATTRFTAVFLGAGRLERGRRALLSGVGSAVAVGAALAVGAWLSAPWWVDLVGLPQTLLLPTIALIVTQSAYVGFKAGLYGVGRIGAYARMEVLAGLTFFCALAMVVTGVSSALLAPFLLANAVFIAMAAWRLWRDGLGTAIDIADGSADTSSGNYAGVSMPRFVVIATIGAAAALARVHLAVLSTGASWPASEVGFLQAAMAFMAPVLLVPRAMELALFPALSRAFGRTDQSSFARQLGDIQALTSVALAMVAGALLIVGPALLPALLGPQFAAAQGALDGVIASAWLLGLAAPAIIALASAGSIAVPNVAGVLGLVASLIAWAWLVPSAGAGGAAAGLALGSLVTAAIPLAAAQFRYQHVAFSDLLLLVLSLGLLALALTVTRWGPAPPLAVAFLYMALVALLHRGRLVATAVAVRNAW